MNLVQDFPEPPSVGNPRPNILHPSSQKTVMKSTALLICGIVLLNVATLAIIVLGVYALHVSPYTGIKLVLENNRWVVNHNERSSPPAVANIPVGLKITGVGNVPVEKADFTRFPEFLQKTSEEKWWSKQRAFYEILQENNTVAVETARNDGTKAVTTATVQKGMPFPQIIKRTLLVYVSALLWMVVGIFAVPDLINPGARFRTIQGRKTRQQPSPPLKPLCAYFSAFGALFLASVAPIANRDLALSPTLFHLLLTAAFIGASGFVTLVHFSFVFPKPKPFVSSRPAIMYLVYFYFILTVALYLASICAFGAIFPFLTVWTPVMVFAFFQSWIREKDPVLKRQMRFGLIAPLVGGIVFLLANLLPPLTGLSQLDFNYFALTSLLFPVTISFVTENYRLYAEQIRGDQAHQEERGRIMDVLHDSLGNDLSHIRMCSEVLIKNLSGDIQKARENIGFISETSQNCVKQLRNFMWATDTKYPTWGDFISYFKEYGSELFQAGEIPFDFQYTYDNEAPHPDSSMKFCLLSMYKEILGNIIKHARAKKVSVNLRLSAKELEMKLHDDGIGFVLEEAIKEGHYGIRNMQKRAKELGGEFNLYSKKGKGTLVHLKIPIG